MNHFMALVFVGSAFSSLLWTGTRNAQPRVCEASLDKVKQRKRIKSLGTLGVP
jgi:hypothetical protein